MATVRVANAASPPEDLGEQLVAVVNSGHPGVIGRFVDESISPALVRRVGRDSLVEMLLGEAATGLDVLSSEQAGDAAHHFVVRRGPSWRLLRVVVDAAEPTRIARFAVWPIPMPGFEDAAPAESLDDLRGLLDRYAAALDRAGAFSGVIRLELDGKVIFQHASGEASIRYGIPNAVDTRFNIGSINKVLTALIVLRLHAESRVDLDDPVRDRLPELYAELIDPRVTVRHLLAHTGGLHDATESMEWILGDSALTRSHHEQSLDDLGAGQARDPGAVWSYSNLGFRVLGLMIEHVTGMEYERVLVDLVLSQFGMADTGMVDIDAVVPGLAVGHTTAGIAPDDLPRPVGTLRENTVLLSRMGLRGGPAGAAYATAGDLARLGNALWRAENLSDDLADDMREPLHAIGPPDVFYGLGLMIDRRYALASFGHTGGFFGIYADLRVIPLEDGRCYTLVVLSNRDTDFIPADFIHQSLPVAP